MVDQPGGDTPEQDAHRTSAPMWADGDRVGSVVDGLVLEHLGRRPFRDGDADPDASLDRAAGGREIRVGGRVRPIRGSTSTSKFCPRETPAGPSGGRPRSPPASRRSRRRRVPTPSHLARRLRRHLTRFVPCRDARRHARSRHRGSPRSQPPQIRSRPQWEAALRNSHPRDLGCLPCGPPSRASSSCIRRLPGSAVVALHVGGTSPGAPERMVCRPGRL